MESLFVFVLYKCISGLHSTVLEYEIYQPNVFIYAWGSFLTATTHPRGRLPYIFACSCCRLVRAATLLNITLLDVSSHLGNYEDVDSYFIHCPEAAQPTITFLGTVCEREGQLNNRPTLLHYHLQSTVYHTSNHTHYTFPLTAYFKSSQHGVNFPSLSINTQIFITGHIFGLTKEHQQLAIITEDVPFLPALPQSMPTTLSSILGKRQRLE
ncbi:hypothetical protein ASPFODRAFT_606716 [Aspergillus luchuensis CBS 106.47]|uniref:Uncharacterized protein n=1 Tax=Aspergillus luchuensis (strain CBS 106.47) TaxID=1137211 RepID=A0A1M3TIK9_ASPLC|nr:hypothetical protein ASPFODRAFT_606716 [Aspergillus luchuensis CBS 106.47]